MKTAGIMTSLKDDEVEHNETERHNTSLHFTTLKPGFHNLSLRPEFTGRVDGP